MSAGGMGVSVALKSGGPNSHLCPRSCKNGDFSCVCEKWKVGNFFESQLQLRRTWTYRNKSSQVKFIQLTKISLVFCEKTH